MALSLSSKIWWLAVFLHKPLFYFTTLVFEPRARFLECVIGLEWKSHVENHNSYHLPVKMHFFFILGIFQRLWFLRYKGIRLPTETFSVAPDIQLSCFTSTYQSNFFSQQRQRGPNVRPAVLMNRSAFNHTVSYWVPFNSSLFPFSKSY